MNLEKYSLICSSAKLFGEDHHINGCNRHYLFNLSAFERGMTVGARRAGRNISQTADLAQPSQGCTEDGRQTG